MPFKKKTKANTEHNSIGLQRDRIRFLYSTPFFSSSINFFSFLELSAAKLSISIMSLLFLLFFLFHFYDGPLTTRHEQLRPFLIKGYRRGREMKIVDKTGCSQFYYVRRKSKLKKAKKNGNDIVPKWKKKNRKRRELVYVDYQTKKKGAIKALFSSSSSSFFRGVKEEDFDTLKTSGPE